MPRLGSRLRFVLSVVIVAALCFTMRGAPALFAKDQDKAPAAKKQTAAEKAAAKKKAGKKRQGDGNQSDDSSGGSVSGNSASSGGATFVPGNGGNGAATPPKREGVGPGGNSNAGGGKPAANPKPGEEAPPGGKPKEQPTGRLDDTHALVKKVMAVQKRITPDLIKQKGIVGTSTGLDEDGNVVVRVHTTGADSPIIPKQSDGVAIQEVLTGPIHPYWQAPFNPKARQPRPVPIGVSAFDDVLLAGGCASGTLGCRVRDKSGNVYGLSNNHVFAGQNGTEGGVVIGTQIVNPSPGDNNCNINIAQDVLGALYKFKPLDPGGPINFIDAAIMSTDVSLVGNSTPPPPIAYGTPRTALWKKPFLGLKVQKLGRTSGFTKGIVSGINAFEVVPYTPGIVFFDNQIEFLGTNAPSLGAPGDSGSLIVTNDALGDRFPIALLFAGGGGITVGNPIQAVLDYFGVSIDGDGSDFIPPGKNGRAHQNQP